MSIEFDRIRSTSRLSDQMPNNPHRFQTSQSWSQGPSFPSDIRNRSTSMRAETDDRRRAVSVVEEPKEHAV